MDMLANKSLLAALLIGALSACGGDDDDMGSNMGDMDHEIAAPSDLTAAIVAEGVHLTWRDNSTNEESFMVVRKDEASDWAPVATAEANSTAFHDMTVESGTTYTYFVHAMSAEAESDPSNEVTIAVP